MLNSIGAVGPYAYKSNVYPDWQASESQQTAFRIEVSEVPLPSAFYLITFAFTCLTGLRQKK